MRRGNLGDSRTWNIPQLARGANITCRQANITLATREYYLCEAQISLQQSCNITRRR